MSMITRVSFIPHDHVMLLKKKSPLRNGISLLGNQANLVREIWQNYI